jgi:hypothetical protein
MQPYRETFLHKKTPIMKPFLHKRNVFILNYCYNIAITIYELIDYYFRRIKTIVLLNG